MIIDNKKINDLLNKNSTANAIDMIIEQQKKQDDSIKEAYALIDKSIKQLKVLMSSVDKNDSFSNSINELSKTLQSSLDKLRPKETVTDNTDIVNALTAISKVLASTDISSKIDAVGNKIIEKLSEKKEKRKLTIQISRDQTGKMIGGTIQEH